MTRAHLAIVDRALGEVLLGPAAVPSASGGAPDWELRGGVSAERFARLRRDVQSLVCESS